MKNKKIEIIIHKFLANTATLDEIDILAKWVYVRICFEHSYIISS